MNTKEVFNYTNQHVLNRYKKDYPHNRLSAEDALAELTKYFWLCYQHRQAKKNNPDDLSLNFVCAMHEDMMEIDDMWHTFLLFTHDYHEFCQHYFGEYLHHVPTTEKNKPTVAEYERELTCYFSYIYDNLGEATLKKWFAKTLNEAA